VFEGYGNNGEREKILGRWVPLGPSPSVGLFKNCFGDGMCTIEFIESEEEIIKESGGGKVLTFIYSQFFHQKGDICTTRRVYRGPRRGARGSRIFGESSIRGSQFGSNPRTLVVIPYA
jgi:hypothetical protein